MARLPRVAEEIIEFRARYLFRSLPRQGPLEEQPARFVGFMNSLIRAGAIRGN